MSDYHKQELLALTEDWTNGQLETYIKQLEIRLTETRNWIRELNALKKRRTKYKDVKDTGIRSG